MGIVTPTGLYETSPSSVATGAERPFQITADGKTVVSGTITATPSAVGAGTAAAAGRVTLASDDPAVAALQIVDDWDESDRAKVNIIVGQAGVAADTGVTGVTVPRVVLADNGGPTSASRIVSAAADTNATSAKGSAGVLYHARGYNAASALRYLKFYNKATAPTVGTDTPVLTLALPPNAAFSFDWPIGRYFATGIAYGMVTGSADNSTAALTAADVVGLNVEYR